MSNLIACRLGSYGKYADRGWTHLREIGISHVEIAVPPLEQAKAVRQHLADMGLAASSLQAQCDIQQPDAVDVMKPQLEACARNGAKICFNSAHAGKTSLRLI